MRVGTQRSLLVVAATVAVTSSVVAQDNIAGKSANPDDRIEEVFVYGDMNRFGATKSNTPIVDTARSLSIETADAFTEKGALNLSQTTAYMPGVTAETYGFATRGDWIRSRGLDIPRYRDSIQELFGSYNTTRTEVYTIEQVEVLRGPASVLYGQGSPGGIVNVVSKTPKTETGGEVTAQVGNFSRQQLGIDLNGTVGADAALRGRFVAFYRDSDTQVDNVFDDTLVLMPSLTFAPTPDTAITGILLRQETESDTGSQFVPVAGTLQPGPGGVALDQDVYAGEPGFNRFDTESTQITLLAEHRLTGDWYINATALWRDGEADYHQAWPIFTGAGSSRYLNDIVGDAIATPTTVPRSFYQADNTSEQKALDVRLSGSFTTGALGHELLFGVQYQDVETDNNVSFLYGGGALSGDYRFALDLANPVYTGAPEQSVFDAIYSDNPAQQIDDLGLYISDQISWKNWRVTAGVRYDELENTNGALVQTDSETSISAAVMYSFDNGLSPYLNYAESFETVVGQTLAGDPLEPERASQVEAGIKYESLAFPGYFTLAYFDIDITNLPNPNSLPGDAAQQQGESTLRGIELEGKFRLGDFAVQVAYATLDAKDPNGFALSASPDGQASAWVTWEPSALQGFHAGGGVRWVGESVSENNNLRYVTQDYFLGDLMLGYAMGNGLDLAMNVRNVTDEQYLTSCLTRGDCFPGMRRQLSASLTYAF
ncbi:TonB-dependent siderophore receptor [Chromatocurvus halotolerans]|uniref:Iron complex outermembrane receptor protein n=1 Tax=Chromatocurvus halotolerans TaxID=1132028 RepID=A0A4V2SAM5_9GAMM|nr:TonB-dependent siderophore receptor [Chromatocurvus halotolerans]TCO72200.1 iron complex outermembrane receptor protein [Chromatocurvus halotolerans]